jgi:beta-galactosidase
LRESDAAHLTRFVENGGTLLATYFSGIVDENEQVVLGGYPGYLRRVLGLRVEEWIPLADHQSNQVRFENGTLAIAKKWTEVVHLEGAAAFAHYTDGFHAGSPAITVNPYGAGQAFYLSTQPDDNGLTALLDRVTAATDIIPVLTTPRQVEVTLRQRGGRRFLCLLNHGAAAAIVDLGAHRGTDLLTGRVAVDRLELGARDAAFIQLA